MAISLNQLNQFYLNNTINLPPLNSTYYTVLYPQNGDRIVNIDYVTSLHPIYTHMRHQRHRKLPLLTIINVELAS